MKKQVIRFAQRALIYSIPIWGLLLSMEIIQRIIPNEYSAKKSYLETQADSVETLILGSSHAYMGMNPDWLPGKGYNLAATAQTLYFDQFLFHQYLDSLPHLDRVILSVSYPSLGSESYLFPGIYNKSYHYAYFYGSDAFVDLLAPRRYSLVSLFTTRRAAESSWAYLQGIPSEVEFDTQGWFTDSSQLDIERNGRDAARLHNTFYDTSLVATNIGYIRNLLSSCQKRGIQVYLVSTPMEAAYRAQMVPERYKLMQDSISALASSFKVPYYDFTYDERFVKADFFDSNHLRTRGAKKLCALLSSLMLEKSGE